ncbi:DMT family transporter [Megalodesulfovibrio gigas]|uniref:Guanidinium exporter n=1 Tax=Megalodesulfovibrio gigas (strain ATCC 19364 / DSM 1382 / NCIMB 9332 / VKM B-1759) TaxID=1121448 RepID=T2GEM7_MEGG1|nr:multidrug efflux SMR transporter [Megalodesulfovibrio gigas]AGW14387.1 putative molecular chaperone, SugES-like protein [Megalodesulfovibrio gigas DSM 1382 = ATCC 19364]
MAWGWLLLAAVCEVAWAVGLKWTDGFSKAGPTVCVVAAMVASMLFLGLAAKTLPLSVAYPIWTGVGVLGVSLFGMLLLQEPASVGKVLCILLICAGAAGLKLLET